jgi:hypothetical protein
MNIWIIKLRSRMILVNQKYMKMRHHLTASCLESRTKTQICSGVIYLNISDHLVCTRTFETTLILLILQLIKTILRIILNRVIEFNYEFPISIIVIVEITNH